MFDELIDEINQLATEFAKKFLTKNLIELSRTEQVKVIMQADFYRELVNDKRFFKSLEKFKKKYEGVLDELINDAKRMKVKQISKLTIENLSLVYEIDATWLLGSAQSYADILRSTLLKGVIAGLDNNELLAQIENIPLFDYQKRVLINQSFTNYRNLVIEKIFGDTEVKFKLAGPLDEKTRDVCRHALETQREEGYTIEEIQKGALPGIDWYNVGGFNCRHYFEAIIE